MCAHMFVPTFSFTVSMLHENEPWIVLISERRTAEFDDVTAFTAWAQERYPPNRYRVDLDPGQLAPLFDRGS